eukprot:scaffold21517_cov99-Isochrysis_galbana.AAC.3
MLRIRTVHVGTGGWLVALTPLLAAAWSHTRIEYAPRDTHDTTVSSHRTYAYVELFAYEMAYAACVATAHLNGQGLAVHPRTYFCDLLPDGARSP